LSTQLVADTSLYYMSLLLLRCNCFA